MLGCCGNMREIRRQTAEEIERDERPATDDVLDARSEKKQINHVAQEVEKTSVDEKRCDISVPHRFARPQPQVIQYPLLRIAVGLKKGNERGQPNERVRADERERNYGIAPRAIVDPGWDNEKHLASS